MAQRRALFLAHFAANCNVREAAAAAGVPVPTLYLWRRSESDFASEWAEALAAGYEMLEARLMEHALAGGTSAASTTLEGLAGTPVAPLNIELALKLLSYRRPGAPQQVRRGRPTRHPVTREAMMAELLNRIDAMEKHKRRQAARLAAKGAPPSVLTHESGGQ